MRELLCEVCDPQTRGPAPIKVGVNKDLQTAISSKTALQLGFTFLAVFLEVRVLPTWNKEDILQDTQGIKSVATDFLSVSRSQTCKGTSLTRARCTHTAALLRLVHHVIKQLGRGRKNKPTLETCSSLGPNLPVSGE